MAVVQSTKRETLINLNSQQLTYLTYRGFRYLADVAFEWSSIFRLWISYFVGGFWYLGSWIL